MIGDVEIWFVIFLRQALYVRWANWLPGEFKHVMALGCRPDGVWILASSGIGHHGLIFMPELMLGEHIEGLLDEAVVVQMPGSTPKVSGLWCNRAVARLIGIPSCALMPDGLFRECLRHGGTIVIGEKYDGRRHLWPDIGAEDGGKCPETRAHAVDAGEDRLVAGRYEPTHARPDPEVRGRADKLKWQMPTLSRKKPWIGFSVPARQRH